MVVPTTNVVSLIVATNDRIKLYELRCVRERLQKLRQ